MAKNENCVVSDSTLCRWMNCDCNNCYINAFKSDSDAKKALSDFEVTLSLLPGDFDDLQGDKCCFCKGEKRQRVGYALIDLAHSEPESKKGAFFGLGKKVKQRIGSLMPLSVSICKECKRGFKLAESIKWLSIVAFVAIAIGIMMIPSVSDATINVNPALPYGIVLLGFLIGYTVGKIVSDRYIKAKSEKIRFNVFEIPVCTEMKNNGWFTMQDDGPVTRLIYSKKSHTRKMKYIKQEDETQEKEDFTQTCFLED